ncbi:histone deacetylase HDT2-like [Brassica rapa]|uniref:histone deacetylase HDT2-like n=1 Tax=Brassica campestris TaxID=3711 RepID=UPI0008722417|nr:histone deacetylase HDT2-like [Brassica rapa]XP_022555909.2 histone deacetylase HDT2-like [Brassica napus]
MEFWGAKVKAGKTLKVKPGENCLIHISQASLGKAKKGVFGLLYATVDDKKLLLGTLSQDSFPHINFDHLLFDREFELSHTLDRGYVHFIGHQRKKKKRANESSKTPVSFNTGKSVLQPCSESKTNQKKQKIQKENSEEIKEMNKSIKELSEAVKTLQQILLTKADLPEEKETPKNEDSCCFGCEEATGNNEQTIFVKGFENLRPRAEIKNALSNFFGSCGEITRVYVPFECKNRIPLGFAFIDLRKGEGNEKALELNGSYMGGKELEVTMASHRDEYYGFTDFHGCERCPVFLDHIYFPSSIKHRRSVYS